MPQTPRFGVARVTRFYAPLLLQIMSQTLAYPLVAGIVTHGEHGVNALTAFSQGQMVMFMIGSLGGGLVTTGLVFAKTWRGYVAFRRLNSWMLGTLIAIQCLAAMPPFDCWIFEGFFGMGPDLAAIARDTLLYGAVANSGFFVRNLPLVILFDNLESAKANRATFVRIAATLAFSLVFPRIGLTGPMWGLFALTAGVWIETTLSCLYARPYVLALKASGGAAGDITSSGISGLVAEQFRFTQPLAIGYLLLAASPLVIAAFVARSANPEDMLAIHYVTLGIANPLAAGALRIQTVSVKFLPEYPGDLRLLAYAVVAGLVLGLGPLLFATPLVGDWYFGVFQNVPDRILPTARLAVGLYSIVCVFHAVRGRIEGIAAAKKRPDAIMAGQIAYTVSLFLVCAVMLPLGCAGWAMAVTSISLAPACVTLAVYAMLFLRKV